jgi:putative sterol carrier protein
VNALSGEDTATATRHDRQTMPAVTSDPTAKFFDDLGRRGHEPLLKKATGSARFEVVDGKRTRRWLLTVEKGDVRVSRRNARADATLRTGKKSFDRIVAGELNLVAAVLRGEVAIQGDPRLLVLLQRLFPRPSGRLRRRRTSRSSRNAT